MQMLCMRHRISTEGSTNKGAKELKHSSKNLQQQWPRGYHGFSAGRGVDPAGNAPGDGYSIPVICGKLENLISLEYSFPSEMISDYTFKLNSCGANKVRSILLLVQVSSSNLPKELQIYPINKTAQLKTDLAEPVVTRSDDTVVKITEHSIAVNDEDDNLDGAENESARTMASVTAPKQSFTKPLRSGEDDDISGVGQTSKIINTEDSVKNKKTDIQLVETETGKEIDPELVADVGQIPSDEESLSIDDLFKRIPGDMMLPSVTAAEPTEIKFGHGITINGVTDEDWYKENLPKIDVADKGKAPFVEPRHTVLESVKDIAAQEEHVLTWAETDSVQVALQRRLYIVAKYRELLLRKCLEAHRAYFSFSQPWSAMVLQIIDLLSASHSTSVKNLLTQKQALKLEWTRPNHKIIFSTCWVRNLRFTEGSWLVEDGYDRWVCGCAAPVSQLWEQLPQRILLDSWVRNLRFTEGSWLVEDGYDRWVCGCAAPVSQLWEQLPQRILLDTLASIGFFIEPAQCLRNLTPPTVKTWGW
ncbi:splicing factor 3B subunit 1-like [Dorcoceras hygrometricum]|uniref:Splicing factor 3B subunit 1-like n=1 Tax=Dorcoceras hygrometricum TaxID=472368 RepID=A0A2Z7BQU2_9LAMI|nr:splicing factor 3B subunit 1-like [Dorcoceras hygrometricum]